MSQQPTVYYPPNLPGHFVANVPSEGFKMVPLRPNGWADRAPFHGHIAGLRIVSTNEAGYQLRTAGWEG